MDNFDLSNFNDNERQYIEYMLKCGMKSNGIEYSNHYPNEWIYETNDKNYWIVDLYDSENGCTRFTPLIYKFKYEKENDYFIVKDDGVECYKPNNFEEFVKILGEIIAFIKNVKVLNAKEQIEKDFKE